MFWNTSRRAVLAMMLSGTLARTTRLTKSGPPADDQPAEQVLLRDYGVDPSGRTSSSTALTVALAAGRRVMGSPGDVYLLDTPVVVPPGREIIGNGATLRIGPNLIGLRLENDGCAVSDWIIRSEDSLYAVLNTGRYNTFSGNVCTGNIGHFFFSTHAEHVVATDNRVDGLSADREITTAIVVENSRNITVTRNRFEQIPVGWAVQIRKGSENFTIAENSFVQTQWTNSRKAGLGQQVFIFTLGSVCLFKKVQIDGKPLSLGYTISGKGPTYTVMFDRGRTAGETITLIGYRGAENIQITTGSRAGVIIGNTIDGTGDSGIICYGSHLVVANNTVRNCGYAGVAIYGDQDHITIKDNVIADCSQMDDGLASPDDPQLASVFAGAILASGEDARITGNTIINDSGTMRYAIRINKTDMVLRTDGRATITILGNTYRCGFADGRIFAPNETSGARINSIAVEGPVVSYPGQVDLDHPWVNAPLGGRNITITGFGKICAVRDTAIKRGGVASLRTVAGEYVDFTLSKAAIFRNCNVALTFWARATSGSSYVSVFTSLEGLLYPLTAQIADRKWKRYLISFPLTAKLDDTILIRCGAMSGSANIQHITIEGRRL